MDDFVVDEEGNAVVLEDEEEEIEESREDDQGKLQVRLLGQTSLGQFFNVDRFKEINEKGEAGPREIEHDQVRPASRRV